MKRLFCSELAFWIFTTVLLAVALTVGLKWQGDPGDMPEEGKAASCDNYAKTAPSHRCKCGKAIHTDCDKPDPDVEMDKSCATYYRKQNCKCLSACTTHMKTKSNGHNAD